MQTVVLILIALFQIGIVFILIYTKKYLGAKASNKAMQEDIGQITEIVEKIKSDLSQQGNLINAQLSHKSKYALEIKQEERQAYIDFNRKISAWLYSIVRFNFSEYNLDNYRELKSMFNIFSSRQYESDVADAHLGLFTKEKEFHLKKLDLEGAILTLENITEKAILTISLAYEECDIEVNSNPSDYKTHSKARNELYAKVVTIHGKYLDDFKEQYKIVIAEKEILENMIQEKIRTLEVLE